MWDPAAAMLAQRSYWIDSSHTVQRNRFYAQFGHQQIPRALDLHHPSMSPDYFRLIFISEAKAKEKPKIGVTLLNYLLTYLHNRRVNSLLRGNQAVATITLFSNKWIIHCILNYYTFYSRLMERKVFTL